MLTCVSKRSIVAFLAGIVLLVGVAGPAIAQIVLTRPVAVDVATSRAVLVVLRNDTPFQIEGFTISLLNTGDSPVCIWRVSVARFDPADIALHPGQLGTGYGFVVDDNDDNIRSVDEGDEEVTPPARIVHIFRDNSTYSTVVNAAIPAGATFVIMAHFSDRAPEGALLSIAPAWGNTITIIYDAGQ